MERESNRLLLYPVSDRTEGTLLPIIERHVEKGSCVYSDGWSAYCPLNDLGYQHFTVLHKYSFKKTYVNKETKEEVEVHTNRIEGAWKHAKDHFRKMAGTKLTQFEGHLAEIMWRADVKTDIYSCFFDQLRSIYTLSGPPVYHYTTPLFETWTGIPEASDSQLTYWEIKPGIFIAMFCFKILSNNGFFLTACLIDTFPLKFLENTDAETDSSTSDVDHDDIPIITSDTTSSSIPPNRELSSMELKERRARMSDSFDALMHAMFSASDDSSEADNTLTGNFSFTTDVHACDTSSSHQHLKPLFNF